MMAADTSPIIAFSRIGRLDLLRAVAGEVTIPEAVYHELVYRKPGPPSKGELDAETWVKVQPVVRLLSIPTLHAGEREAISLALELGVPQLMDEERGRRAARRRRVEVIGTLGILATAKDRGLVGEVRPLVDAIEASGYWLSAELVRGFLRTLRE